MFMLFISTAPRNEGSLKTEDAKVQYREKADIKAKLEEARQRRLALENSRYGDMEGPPSDAREYALQNEWGYLFVREGDKSI